MRCKSWKFHEAAGGQYLLDPGCCDTREQYYSCSWFSCGYPSLSPLTQATSDLRPGLFDRQADAPSVAVRCLDISNFFCLNRIPRSANILFVCLSGSILSRALFKLHKAIEIISGHPQWSLSVNVWTFLLVRSSLTLRIKHWFLSNDIGRKNGQSHI